MILCLLEVFLPRVAQILVSRLDFLAGEWVASILSGIWK